MPTLTDTQLEEIVEVAAQSAVKALLMSQKGATSQRGTVLDRSVLAFKHDATGNPSTAGFFHGPGGLLTYPGVDPDVYNAIIGQLPGISNMLPTRGSVYNTPVFETLTGVSEPGGAEDRAACDDALVGGIVSGCKVTFPFGRIERQTREVEVNRLGLLNDRAEPLDLRLVGSAFFGSAFGGASALPANVMNSEIDRLFFERALSFARKFNELTWEGDPANNAGAGYKEFGGLQVMLSSTTGWRDAETGVACVALKPDLKDFKCARIDSNGDELVNIISTALRYVGDIASRTGLAPVRWVIAMRPKLWWELTKVWPCSYMTTVCSTTDSAFTYNIDMASQARFRDDMRSRNVLLVDGKEYEVILDDSIPERNQGNENRVQSGCFCSDIYILPMSVLGGRSVLYYEYLDYSNPQNAAVSGAGMGLFSVTGGGAYLETASQKNWCIKWQAKIEPRLIFKTPQLSARIQNVAYCPLQNPPEPFPDDPYYRNGGQTSRPGPSLYNPFTSALLR